MIKLGMIRNRWLSVWIGSWITAIWLPFYQWELLLTGFLFGFVYWVSVAEYEESEKGK